jgi:hypothetical protein
LFGIIIDALGGTGQEGENIVTDAGILDSKHEQSKVGLLQIGGDPRNPPLTDEGYRAEMDNYYGSILRGDYDDVVNTFSAFKHALDTLNVERDRDTDKGRIVYYELPTPPSQCERAGSTEKDKPLCWLCGCPTGLKNDQEIAMRKVEHSRAECEHVLPAPLMCLLEILYNKNIDDASLTQVQKDLRTLCYDNSCHLCNWQKSDAMFIQRQNIDGVFQPFKPNPMIIITELLNYFMTLAGTKSSDTDPVFWRGALDPEIRSYGSIVRVGRQDAAPPPQRKFYPNLIRASLVGIPGAVYYGSANPIRTATNNAIAQNATDAMGRNDPDVAREAFGANRDARTALESISSDISAYYRTYKTLPRGAAAAPAVENALAGRTWTTSGNLDVATKSLMTVNKRAAVNWIIRRFCSVFDYVNRICGILNTQDGTRLWEGKKAAIGGLTVSPMTWLKRLSNDNNGPVVYAAWRQKMEAKRLMSGKKRKIGEVGGFRFTIRRRSETRQTKKNRRRKVIEVSV